MTPNLLGNFSYGKSMHGCNLREVNFCWDSDFYEEAFSSLAIFDLSYIKMNYSFCFLNFPQICAYLLQLFF